MILLTRKVQNHCANPALKLVEPMGVEPTICLLAKQMPLPHSSHGPVKMNDDFAIMETGASIRN